MMFLSLSRSINRTRCCRIGSCYNSIEKRYKTYFAQPEQLTIKPGVNASKAVERELYLDLNESRLPSGSAVPIHVPKHVNKDIKIVLDTCQNSQQIVSLIQRQHNEIQHSSIYGKAMQICRKLRDFDAVQTIMDLFLTRTDLQPTCIEFTIYINSMAVTEYSQRCVQYFHLMISKYNIQPNDVVFATLLKSFTRKIQIQEAEKVWDMMINQYNLEPNEAAYSAMMTIYSLSQEKEKATRLLNEYVSKHPENIRGHNGIFSPYINVFSKLGDIKGMKKAIKLCSENGLKFDNQIIVAILKVYYQNGKYDKIIQIVNDWISRKKNDRPSRQIFFYKLIALSHMIKQCQKGFEAKKKIYDKLVNTLYIELKKYQIELDPLLVKPHLNGAIFLYSDHDPQQIVQVFESLMKKNLIGYMLYDEKKRQKSIDLHVNDLTDAQFIIRYIFAYKLNDIIQKDQDYVCIVTGKGRHTWTKGKGTGQGAMQKFIIQELLSWDPPINAETRWNGGRIWIHKKYFQPYLDNENNYAKRKLCVPSDDWYYDDRRNAKRKKIKKIKTKKEFSDNKQYNDAYEDILNSFCKLCLDHNIHPVEQMKNARIFEELFRDGVFNDCESFDDIFNRVKEYKYKKNMNGYGELTMYDTALTIGRLMSIYPDKLWIIGSKPTRIIKQFDLFDKVKNKSIDDVNVVKNYFKNKLETDSNFADWMKFEMDAFKQMDKKEPGFLFLKPSDRDQSDTKIQSDAKDLDVNIGQLSCHAAHILLYDLAAE